jgi:hypothetical protein
MQPWSHDRHVAHNEHSAIRVSGLALTSVLTAACFVSIRTAADRPVAVQVTSLVPLKRRHTPTMRANRHAAQPTTKVSNTAMTGEGLMARLSLSEEHRPCRAGMSGIPVNFAQVSLPGGSGAGD